MEELLNLYHAVTSVEASCGMTKDQQVTYAELNKVYNRLTKERFIYNICRKRLLVRKVEAYLAQNGYTSN